MIRSFEVELRLPVRRAGYRPPDLSSQRHELAPQLVPRIAEQRRGWSKAGKLGSRRTRGSRRIQFPIDLSQKLILQCPPVGIDRHASLRELGPNPPPQVVQH